MGDDKTDGDGVCCRETKEIGRGGGSYTYNDIFRTIKNRTTGIAR